jgi:cytochrome P450
MTHTDGSNTDEWFDELFMDGAQDQIYGPLAAARANCPVPHSEAHGNNPRSRRNITRWRDVDKVLRDAGRFSSALSRDDIPYTGQKILLAMDDDEHRQHRALVEKAFTPGAIRRWEEELAEPLIRGLLRAVRDRGHAELVSEVIRLYPVQIICSMLGVPLDRIEDFQRWGTQMILGAYDPHAAKLAATSMTEYLRPIVEDRRREPRDDLISDLIRAELDGQGLDDEALYSFLRLLLPAGADTTWRAFGSMMVALLTRPDVLSQVTADRAMVSSVIEESLRWETPSPRVVRLATADVEIAGCPIDAGTPLEVWIGSANHDESRFDAPEEWRLGRDKRHVSFGTGRHICLGIHLARMELKVGLNAVLDELPGLRLDPAYGVPEITGHALRGPTEIRVLFDRRV